MEIYLPALATTSALRPTAAPSEARRGQGRILVMDDDPAITEAIGVILESHGYEVTVASEGRDAIEYYAEARIQGRPFALVIMDLTIPGGMGGQEAFQKLRRIDPTVRGIVCSGYSNDPVMAEFERHGFQGVLAKPYRPAALVNLVHRLVLDEAPVE